MVALNFTIQEVKNEFKLSFIYENQKRKFPKDMFHECGFDINLIDLKRMQS